MQQLENKRYFVQPVQMAVEPVVYPQPAYPTQESLEAMLRSKGLEVELKETLKGGTVSQVYGAVLGGKPVVVKHTEDLVPFDPTELFISKEGHAVDADILQRLARSRVTVPKVLQYLPEETTTVMEDLREKGFGLMWEKIMGGAFVPQMAEKVGERLAWLSQEMRGWQSTSYTETAEGNIYERGLELRMAYPNDQEAYLVLEKLYCAGQEMMWPDSHPKNMLVNDKGEVAFIDFGRSHKADQRYMLPNFLAHLVIYGLGGYISGDVVAEGIERAVAAYRGVEAYEDEVVLCRYLAMEVLHRANGKWIDGIKTVEQKLACMRFGLTVFDEGVEEIHQLLSLITKN